MPGEEIQYSFTTPLTISTTNTYTLKLTATLTDDQNQFNDEFEEDFFVALEGTALEFEEDFEENGILPPGWSIINGDGNLTTTFQNAPTYVTVPTIHTMLNGYTKDSVHRYDGTLGLPYEATMESNVSNWMIYDENNQTAETNKHIVIFQAETTWTGEHETNTTTKTQKVRRVNRRTMW